MDIFLSLFLKLRGELNSKTFEDAHEDCKLSGGHLAEIKDQAYTSAYLSELIARQASPVEKYWIGGLRNYIAGKKFDVWYDSVDILKFDGFPRHNNIPTNGLQNDDVSYGITIRNRQSRA